jgi:hypothetical protein
MRDFSALPHQSQVHRWTAETLLWGRLHAEGRTWGDAGSLHLQNQDEPAVW